MSYVKAVNSVMLHKIESIRDMKASGFAFVMVENLESRTAGAGVQISFLVDEHTLVSLNFAVGDRILPTSQTVINEHAISFAEAGLRGLRKSDGSSLRLASEFVKTDLDFLVSQFDDPSESSINQFCILTTAFAGAYCKVRIFGPADRIDLGSIIQRLSVLICEACRDLLTEESKVALVKFIPNEALGESQSTYDEDNQLIRALMESIQNAPQVDLKFGGRDEHVSDDPRLGYSIRFYTHESVKVDLFIYIGHSGEIRTDEQIQECHRSALQQVAIAYDVPEVLNARVRRSEELAQTDKSFLWSEFEYIKGAEPIKSYLLTTSTLGFVCKTRISHNRGVSFDLRSVIKRISELVSSAELELGRRAA